MRKNLLVFMILSTACGASDLNHGIADTKAFLRSATDPQSSNTSEAHIDCIASVYKNSAWTELGTFSSPKEPVVIGGESMQNAEFTSSDGIRFSAAGNFEEGLMYFGSIADPSSRVWTQIQLAKTKTIELTLSQGAFENAVQYNLHCKMLR